MGINSNEFAKFIERDLILNSNFDEWNMKIDKLNDIGRLSPEMYQNLKHTINDIKMKF